MTSTNFNLFKSQIYFKDDFHSFAKCQELDRLYFAWPWGHSHWQDLAKDSQNYSLFTIGSENELTGLALYYIPPSSSLVHLLKLIMTPSVRRQGWGQKLLLKSMQDLQKINRSEFYLEVEENNTVALNLYNKIGYKILCRKKDFYGSKRNALAMKYFVQNT